MASLRTFTFYEGSGYLGYNYSGFRTDAGWIRPPALVVGSLLANVFRYILAVTFSANCRYIIHFLMKWVGLWTFHIRYQTLSSFSASGNDEQIIVFFFISVARPPTKLRNRFRSLMIRIYTGFIGL